MKNSYSFKQFFQYVYRKEGQKYVCPEKGKEEMEEWQRIRAHGVYGILPRSAGIWGEGGTHAFRRQILSSGSEKKQSGQLM